MHMKKQIYDDNWQLGRPSHRELDYGVNVVLVIQHRLRILQKTLQKSNLIFNRFDLSAFVKFYERS